MATYKTGVEINTGGKGAYVFSLPGDTRSIIIQASPDGTIFRNASKDGFCDYVTINGTPTAFVLPMKPKSVLEGVCAGSTTVGLWGPQSPYTFNTAAAWQGAMYDIVYTAAVPDVTAREKLQGFLAHANAAATNLPPGHPYAARPPRIS